ncbi:SirB2 family protein [Aquirhabdus sp.]|uniref:SirB2 family protein n=1 Tax=Aquirhabdus sp. TaxID=2824160 RepID=UPI00396C3F5F
MLIKIIHMTAASLTILLFLIQAMLLLKRRSIAGRAEADVVTNVTGLGKLIKILGHVTWTVLIITGLWLLSQLPSFYPHWLLVKIAVFVFAIVFSVLAFRAKSSVTLQNVGLAGAAICYGLIIYLVVMKPWGYVLTSGINQPIVGSASTEIQSTH